MILNFSSCLDPPSTVTNSKRSMPTWRTISSSKIFRHMDWKEHNFPWSSGLCLVGRLRCRGWGALSVGGGDGGCGFSEIQSWWAAPLQAPAACRAICRSCCQYAMAGRLTGLYISAQEFQPAVSVASCPGYTLPSHRLLSVCWRGTECCTRWWSDSSPSLIALRMSSAGISSCSISAISSLAEPSSENTCGLT